MRMTNILRPRRSVGKGRVLTVATLAVAALPVGVAVSVAGGPSDGGLSVVPTKGELTSPFGERFDPFSGEPSTHRGIDITAPLGTPVAAAGAGRITQASKQGGYGLTVVIDHGDGLLTRYAQLDDMTVRWGDVVAAGERIGAVGSSGRSTGPHLHFEVRRGDEWVDPALELPLED